MASDSAQELCAVLMKVRCDRAQLTQISTYGRQRQGEQGEWLRQGGGGWREWVAGAAAEQPKKASGSQVDRLRAELRADFRTALRHAYLGPECAQTSCVQSAP